MSENYKEARASITINVLESVGKNVLDRGKVYIQLATDGCTNQQVTGGLIPLELVLRNPTFLLGFCVDPFGKLDPL